jgi:Tol biopolymer transport system component
MARTAHALSAVLLATAICAVGSQGADAAPLPGNGRIAFVDTSTHSPSIGVINADGSGRHQLTHTLPLMGQPAWRPDGKRIAFVLADRIALMTPVGKGIRRIGGPTLDELAPSWSPTGELAFLRARTTNDDDGWNLVIARSDGSGQRVLTIPDGVKEPEIFGWSADGRRVGWMVSHPGVSHRTLISLDVRSGASTEEAAATQCGAPPAQAARGPLSVCEVQGDRVELLRAGVRVRSIGFTDNEGGVLPAWNPAATQIAYSVDRHSVAVYTLASRRTRTYIVPLRNTGVTETVSWSADGHDLVVGANRAEGWAVQDVDVRTGFVSTIAAHTEDLAPGFSPNGRLLAYIHVPADAPDELRVVEDLELPSQIITRVIGFAGAGVRPYGWAPDSNSLALTTKNSEIWVVGHGRLSVRKLVERAAGQPFWSPDGSTIAYVRDAPGAIEFVRPDGTRSPIATIPGAWVLLGWTADGAGLFVTGTYPTQASIISVAGGTPTVTFGVGTWGSTLSPDGASALLTAFPPPTRDGPFSITLEHVGSSAGGQGPTSVLPAVWSPDGRWVLFSPGTGRWQDGYYDAWAPHTIAIAPADDPAALGAVIPDASSPTWQPLPARSP